MVTGHVAPATTVDRPALRRRLDEALVRPLTLIIAPAGSGKSVLVHQWIASHPELAFAWLDLEDADDDPVRFTQRLLRALAAIGPEIAGLESLVTLHGGGLGAPLIDALSAQMAELPEVVVVLDDLHHLANAILLADLGRLVDVVPPNVHVILSSRVDPPFAWSRHRLQRHLIEIRQSDLAFDEADSAELLERLAGRHLGADHVSALVGRTEGWAAGLQLAAINLRLQDDADDFITQFSGNDRLIVDYLSEEVLNTQPADRRTLLFRLAALDEVCAELVDRVTGTSNAQTLLEELERDSMFVVPLDTRRERFRFHRLFRDMLRYRSRAEDASIERQVLAEAASWHLERDEVDQAVQYLLGAEAWDQVLEVIMTRGPETFERGKTATVILWIESVPEAARPERQDVVLLYGILKGMEGQFTAAVDILRRVAAHPQSSPGERACAEAFLAAQAQWSPNPETSVQMANRALELLDQLGDHPVPDLLHLTDRHSLKTVATISGGRAHFLAGNLPEARAWIRRGLAGDGAAYSLWKVHGLGSLGLLEAWCGRTGRAATLAGQALAIATEVDMLAHPATADAFLALALSALERGEPQRAMLSLHEGTLRAEANRRTQVSWIAHLLQAMARHATRQLDGAALMNLLASIEAGAPPSPIVADRLLALRAKSLRLAGFPEQSLRLTGAEPDNAAALVFERVAAALTLGQVDLATKMMDNAAPALDPDGPRAHVERLILLAWLSELKGNSVGASGHLSDALAVAEPHSLVEAFVRAGPFVAALLADSGASSEFGSRVLRRIREFDVPAPAGALADPLTDRELEILSYLPSRFTNTELAERCYVSLNTMKTHMAHIYRKLDVSNRNAAIVRARQLGLLP